MNTDDPDRENLLRRIDALTAENRDLRDELSRRETLHRELVARLSRAEVHAATLLRERDEAVLRVENLLTRTNIDRERHGG